ncbi:hypothetical protein GCM10022252_76370 [Streptosporangium oxazolinicum]|uniref:DUF3560 domain-containing protein n=1 Tax=Streptosporangium oxazolinicum TaxID=909287 RepID=A0ABP8BL91_9ACTN
MLTVHTSPRQGIIVLGTTRADRRALGNRKNGGAGLRWSDHIEHGDEVGAWFVPHSQGKHNSRNRARAQEIATHLRGLGYQVAEETSDETRDVAEAEADRAERADDRADRFAQYGRNAANRATSRRRASDAAVEGIPAGQPVMSRHHRNALDRSHTNMRAAIDEDRRSAYWGSRAKAAARLQEHRLDPGTTQRRIKKLTADHRRTQRALDGVNHHGHPTTNGPATGEHRERLLFELGELANHLAYWEDLITQAQADGVKIWGPADFTKGDFALRDGHWVEVIRVNLKSLTMPALVATAGRLYTRKEDSPYSWTDPLPYDKVQGRLSAAEAAEKYPPTTAP